ncbi:hypothetical protein AHF37_01417 [Paragonimus kellicotti]|nr:hypothetical protein AHF37_01417 [Paragonimus kellicotti]
MVDLSVLAKGIPLDPLPDPKPRDPSIPHAPNLKPDLDATERKLALSNALRYIPAYLHEQLAPEFAQELATYGHIYMYRFRPDPRILRAHPIDRYPTQCVEAAAIMLMICNNLDRQVAQFPEELVTYGGNGQVFSNWGQFWLVMKALSKLDRKRTLVLYSGHPAGLFPSHEWAPRMVITNGMLVPRPGLQQDYQKLFALGVTQYGQMTAGSYCYIGPQGIVHGTTLTILNAFRRCLASGPKENCKPKDEELIKGRVFLSSGLGGMSGAQAKAAVITGCVGVIAEVSEQALDKRHAQGWLTEKVTDMDGLVKRIRECRKEGKAISIGYLGNVVDVWERMAKEYRETGELLVDIASDQTSCHNVFHGGYYPCGYTYEESRELMVRDNEAFQKAVRASLRRQARILYSDEAGRVAIARAFNEAIRDGRLHGPVVLSRDHHDVSGTDSPYRETSNIYDGSAVCADMSVHNVIGGAMRGATWVSLHNGGGVGWGEVMNGGFGHVLDGSDESIEKACRLLTWDVSNGVVRRAWSGHPLARLVLDYADKHRTSQQNEDLEVLLPERVVDTSVLDRAIKQAYE